ncbi:zinc finger, CCHC-type, Retrotransposon gag domain protein [Artemisia annua]|uniref:Zinc finger, CCHC-type, Retrotransposon gag domain protein n=1 Tax=Artemisia annua TaxID=35608 RepID=A0A2U1N6G1_ARTAN|nr:zinc finger, CCHC-type, Retrotransposon gag domain protein [Artemisia annua]
MATTTIGRCEANTNTSRRVLIDEDYADYMHKYTGVQDPIAANMWIVKMEQFFDCIDAEDEKVVYAEVFKEEFSPLRMEMKLVEDLATLKCRNERLREYTSRFEKLWWFYSCCLTPEKRLIYHYVKGLNANIKDFIPDKDLTSWEKMFAAVSLIHEENSRRLEEMNALNKKKRKVRKQKV